MIKKDLKQNFAKFTKNLLYGSVNFKTLSKSLLKTLLLESFSMRSHKRTSSDPHVIINTICSNFTHVIINKLCRHVSVLTRILFKWWNIWKSYKQNFFVWKFLIDFSNIIANRNISNILSNSLCVYTTHCVKSVRIQSFSGPYFPTFGLNTKRYVFNPNAGKYGPDNSEYGQF